MNDGKKKALKNLKTARGQIDTVINMLEDDRYCIDVANQILAVNGLLKKANLEILSNILTIVLKKLLKKVLVKRKLMKL